MRSVSQAIGVFDSGVGGLSVLRHLRKEYPNETLLYFADQAYVPYGVQSVEDIRHFSEEITRFLLAQGAKIIVVACNTASAAALTYLRELFPDVPIVGMEPAVKPAAMMTKTGKVGVLATPATFASPRYSSLMTYPLQPSFIKTVPDGDTQARAVCENCGFVNYQNPKIVTGSVVRHEGKILMCRRAIEPRRGFWTIPAGYMELHETPEDGALREAREEANAQLRLTGLLAVYTVPRLSQVQLIYRAVLAQPDFSAGIESLEVRLFEPENIPVDEIAFPTVHWALAHDAMVEAGQMPGPFTNPPGGNTNLPAA